MQKLPSFVRNKPIEHPDKRRFRVAGFAMFILAAGLLLARLLAHLLGLALAGSVSEATANIIVTAFFTIIVQVGICFLLMFFVYKRGLGLSTKQVLQLSNFQKTTKLNLVLMVPIGIVGLGVTIGVSSVWMAFITLLGYNRPSEGSNLPDTFSLPLFLLQFFLVAVLPSICEEFAMRGGLFTVLRKSYRGGMFYVLMAVAFGLFHQNITQVFYTALFGALMAFIVVKTKSIYPAMIVHFINNGLSVFFTFASRYGFLGGGIFTLIDYGVRYNPLMVTVSFILACALLAGLLLILHYVNNNKTLHKKKDVIVSSGFDHTHNRVVLVGEVNVQTVRALELEKEVYGEKQKEELYKPNASDKAFFIGAMVTAGVFTVFSFVWGLLV